MIHVKERWLWENNTSICCSILQAEALDLLHSRRGNRWCPPLREDEYFHPHPPQLPPRPAPPPVLWTLPGQRVMWHGDNGRTVPAGCYRTYVSPLTGLHRPIPPLLPRQIKLSAPFDTVPCTRTACSFMMCTGSPATPSFSAFFAAYHGDRIRLWQVGKCLNNVKARWRRRAHTEAWLLVANKDVAVVDFSSNGAYWTQSQAFCFMELRGREQLLSLLTGSSTPVRGWCVFECVYWRRGITPTWCWADEGHSGSPRCCCCCCLWQVGVAAAAEAAATCCCSGRAEWTADRADPSWPVTSARRSHAPTPSSSRTAPWCAPSTPPPPRERHTSGGSSPSPVTREKGNYNKHINSF